MSMNKACQHDWQVLGQSQCVQLNLPVISASATNVQSPYLLRTTGKRVSATGVSVAVGTGVGVDTPYQRLLSSLLHRSEIPEIERNGSGHGDPIAFSKL